MKKLLLIGTLTMLVQGCIIVAGDGEHDGYNYSSGWRAAQEDNRRKIANLELGVTRASVMDSLGKPDFSEAFAQSGNNYQVLFYRTHRTREDGVTTKDETTPLVFENDKLIGWGQDALQRIR